MLDARHHRAEHDAGYVNPVSQQKQKQNTGPITVPVYLEMSHVKWTYGRGDTFYLLSFL